MKNWRNWLKIGAQAIAFILATFGVQQASNHFMPDEPIVLQSVQPVFDTIYTDGLLHYVDPETPDKATRSKIYYAAWVVYKIGGGAKPEYTDVIREETRVAIVYTKHEKSLEYLKGKDPDAVRIIDVAERY